MWRGIIKKGILVFILLLQEALLKCSIELVTVLSPGFYTWMKMKSNMCELFAFKKKIILMDLGFLILLQLKL